MNLSSQALENIANQVLRSLVPLEHFSTSVTRTVLSSPDIILLRTDQLNVMPFNNAVGAVVTNMGAQNVDTVLIAGKVNEAWRPDGGPRFRRAPAPWRRGP
jgi:hypothetical protein